MFRDVLEDMRDRDGRDQERTTAPLKAADDAFVIDTLQWTPPRFTLAVDQITKSSE